jgi:hypothetical protein
VVPYLLVSRSAEYESRLRGLLGGRLAVIAGEFLTFGVDAVIERVGGIPRIALLGPVLNFEETRGLARELTERHPHIGLVVVREQRSDLEDWVDELSLHAVLSPLASDETTVELIDRLSAWLVANGKCPRWPRPARRPTMSWLHWWPVQQLNHLQMLTKLRQTAHSDRISMP